LNAAEQAEVQRYLLNPTDVTLATLRLPDAIAKAAAYKTYYADPAIVAWRAAVHEADIAQRIYTRADALISNERHHFCFVRRRRFWRRSSASLPAAWRRHAITLTATRFTLQRFDVLTHGR
jgi:hypothetical protein